MSKLELLESSKDALTVYPEIHTTATIHLAYM
jgi:hypothetical protein